MVPSLPTMLDKLQEAASNSPPVPSGVVSPLLQFLEVNVRRPLAGTWFDQWIALPAKNYYIAAKRQDWGTGQFHTIKVSVGSPKTTK
jgi:hypothetical protein